MLEALRVQASAVLWPMEPADRNHGNKVSWDVIKAESTNGSFKQVSRSAEHKFGLKGKRQKKRSRLSGDTIRTDWELNHRAPVLQLDWFQLRVCWSDAEKRVS